MRNLSSSTAEGAPRRRRVPAALVPLLCAVVVAGLAWIAVSPPWTAPDENMHFAYSQSLAERFELPGDVNRQPFSAEQRLGSDWSNSDQTAQVLATKPEWSEIAYERWRDRQAELPDGARADGGGPNSAWTNPPLYYLTSAAAYFAASGGDVFDRLYTMRSLGLVFLLVTVIGAWLLAGELFDRNRLLQLVAAAVAGLQPMVSFISTSVNPDGLQFALWSLALWLGVRILKRGLTMGSGAALFAIAGLAVTTKASSWALVPGVLLVLAVGCARLRGSRRRIAALVAVALLALAIPAGAWFATTRALDRPAANQVATGPQGEAPTLTSFSLRDAGSYMWQFYLPKLPFQERYGGLGDLPVYDIWVKTGWAAFGSLEVRFPNAVYVVLALLSVAFLAGGAAYALRRRRTLDPAVAAFFGLLVLVMLAGLHWTEFRTLVTGAGPFNQGRYLLPLIPLGGAAVAGTVALLPPARRPLAAGLVLGGLVVLQLASLGIVVGRFYA